MTSSERTAAAHSAYAIETFAEADKTKAMLAYPLNETVRRCAHCELHAGNGQWSFAVENTAAIDEAWRRAREGNPHYFNGVIHLIDALDTSVDRLHARLLRTDFKSYLYWRQAGFPQTGVLDGFGSALIRSRDGAIILGRQRAGNVNGGLAYLPGGFIDARDVGPDGRIAIAESISRELAEETGLSAADVTREPGFWVTQTAAHVSIAAAYLSDVDAEALKKQIESHIAQDPASELTEAVIVRGPSDLRGLAMPPYARVLLAALFTQAN